jgi:DMSO/TMAO reductase YedYZ molybdopterin-dependent catalytic subunit
MNNSKRAFLKFGVASAAVLAGINALGNVSPHEFNEKITRKVFGEKGLARTFARNEAKEPRANGMVGLEEDPPADWKLNVDGKLFTLDNLKSMQTVNMTTEFMCVEGWSQIVNWTGTPLASILPGNTPDFVSLMTPDELYYVGIDRESALHPQTILAWDMNGAPLTPEHGAPLRLVIPLKYGIKNIKRIGSIKFTSSRPADYWHERNYDYYSGL